MARGWVEQQLEPSSMGVGVLLAAGRAPELRQLGRRLFACADYLIGRGADRNFGLYYNPVPRRRRRSDFSGSF